MYFNSMELTNRYLQAIAYMEGVARGLVAIVIVIDLVNAAIEDDSSLCGCRMTMDRNLCAWDESIQRVRGTGSAGPQQMLISWRFPMFSTVFICFEVKRLLLVHATKNGVINVSR